MIVHAGERCLSCKVRGSEFTKSHDLMRHMFLYTEIFPVCRNIYYNMLCYLKFTLATVFVAANCVTKSLLNS